MVICKSRGRTSAIPKTIEHYPPAFPTFPKELKKKKKDNPLLFCLLCRKYYDTM